MQTTTTTTTITPLQYWTNAALATRDYGHTYVHKAMRGIDYCHSHETGDMTFIWGSYGRSLAGGGHKYKVRAVYTATAQPVPTKILKSL